MNLVINSHATFFWFLLSRIRDRDGLGLFPEATVAYAETMIERLAELTSDNDRLYLSRLGRSCPTCHCTAAPWPTGLHDSKPLTPGYRSIVALALELSSCLAEGVSLAQVNMIMVDILGLERDGLLLNDTSIVATTPLGEARFDVRIRIMRPA